MLYLIDTNIISEIRKGPRCDPHVAAWYDAIKEDDIVLSVLVLGEIRKGIERVRPRDPAKAQALEDWLHAVSKALAGRILAVDEAVSEVWGKLSAIRPVPVIDGLLVATALVHNLILVTRNEADVTGFGAVVVNPFKPQTMG